MPISSNRSNRPAPSPARRRALALLAGALASVASTGSAQTIGRPNDDAGRPGILPGQTAPFRVRLPGAGRFEPERIIVLALDRTFAGRAPQDAVKKGGSRVNLGDAPFVGGLFGSPPATAAVTPERRLGETYRNADALIVDLRRAPIDVADFLSRAISVVSSAPGAPVLELSATLRLDSAPADPTLIASDAPPPGERIGYAYLYGDARSGRLVLSPPRRSLFALF